MPGAPPAPAPSASVPGQTRSRRPSAAPAARSGRATPRRRCGGSGARRGTAATGRAPGRSATRTSSRCSGPQVEVGAAEGHDARVAAARRRPPPAGPSPTPAQKTAKRARVSPPACRRAIRPAATRTPSTPQLVTTGAPAASSSRASARATVGEVDDAGLRRVQRRHAAAVRLDLAQLGRRQPPQPGHPVLAPAPLELVEAGPARSSSRATISLPQRSCADPVRARRTRTSRARPPRTAAP